MKGRIFLRTSLGGAVRITVAVLCVALIGFGDPPFLAGQQPADQSEQAAPIPPDQLDSLVAPIALYPDPLLAQVLAASTYPLEIIQLQQFLAKHRELKDQALVDAVMKEDWDPTVQALAPLPDVVKRLADDIQWTTDLGDAFLAQQSDVMDAVQRMRKKAEDKGALKSDERMMVETKSEGGRDVIVIEQANPEVVYVPSYDPTVVYGAPLYPYPPIYYPPYPAGGLFLSWGIGVAMGAAWGGWCCNSGWSGNNININNNNNFVRNSDRQTGNRGNRTAGGNWQHNPRHRGGAPYGDRRTADRFGGSSRGNRGGGGNRPGGGAGIGNRPSGGTGIGNRPSGGTGVGNRPSGGTGVGNRPSRGGADSIGGRDLSRGGGGGSFGGGRGGFNGGSAGRSSGRGRSSMGGRSGGGGGGGARRGGGGGGRRR